MNVWLVGPRNSLMRAFMRGCSERSVSCECIEETRLDAMPPETLDATLLQTQSTVAVHLGMPLAAAEGDSVAWWRTRCVRPVRLAEACARTGIGLVVLSSAHVFDGRACEPYLESAPTTPTTTRGRAEAAAEAAVLQSHPGAIVVRTSATLDPWCAGDLVSATLASAARGVPVAVDDDPVTSPTYLPDLVSTVLDLASRGETGVWHVANHGAASWYDVARTACAMARLDPALVQARVSSRGADARRTFTALRSARGCRLPTLDDALARYLRVREANVASV